MQLKINTDNQFFLDSIYNICTFLGFEISENGIPTSINKSDCLKVSRNPDAINIEYSTENEIFRALSLLSQNRHSIFSIEEPKKLNNLSVMIDASRNAVLTVDTLKNIISTLALMGLDTIMLYTEDTYTVDGYEYFGYMRGRYTYEELKMLDDYSYAYGIEMIPCIQTLGNMKTPLRWDWMRSITDTNNILLAREEKTYEFLRQAIKCACAPYRSKKIHICMDEAYELGSGAYLSKYGYEKRTDIMRYHLDKVCEICNEFSLTPIMWGDMYIAMGSDSGWCFDTESKITSEIISSCNPNVQLVYWDYNNNDKKIYDKLFEKYMQFNNPLIFAGAVHSWNSFSCHVDRTFYNTNIALSSCKEHGVKNVMATIWGDNGAENHFFTNMLGICLFAEHKYYDNPTNEHIAGRFQICTKADFNKFYSLSKLDQTPYTDPHNLSNSNPAKWLLYQDIMHGLFDKHIENMPDLYSHYESVANEYLSYINENDNYMDVFVVPYHVANVLAMKCDIGVRIKKFYDAGDMIALESVMNYDLNELEARLNQLICAHRKVWYKYYKPFGFEILEARYGAILSGINTAKMRIKSLLDGSVCKLEELDEKRLYFSAYTNPSYPLIDVNDWDKIYSSSPI